MKKKLGLRGRNMHKEGKRNKKEIAERRGHEKERAESKRSQAYLSPSFGCPALRCVMSLTPKHKISLQTLTPCFPIPSHRPLCHCPTLHSSHFSFAFSDIQNAIGREHYDAMSGHAKSTRLQSWRCEPQCGGGPQQAIVRARRQRFPCADWRTANHAGIPAHSPATP